MKFRLIRVCKGEAMAVIPQEVVRYDLKVSAKELSQNGYQVEDKEMMIISKKDGLEITAYVNGRLMINPMADKDKAKAVAERFYELLRKENED